ncbi:hypothetical protein Ctaglu_14400 [Clostridium tagluense]|uniref:Uncharacterized protein n=1 Tax=Clostridium tagluense TaxID=360422 RepID=A0A401UJU1_9CLOT|nr:hypothetical protein Ctaglu_14400 [Clostridium tagluense]
MHFLAAENKINFRITWRSESILAIYTFVIAFYKKKGIMIALNIISGLVNYLLIFEVP